MSHATNQPLRSLGVQLPAHWNNRTNNQLAKVYLLTFWSKFR